MSAARSDGPTVEVDGRQLVERYSSPATEVAAVRGAVGLFDDSFRGILDLAGDGAADVLDRVVSVSSRDLDESRGAAACLLTAKGRLVAGFFLSRLGEGSYRAVLLDPPREAVRREFAKYAFLSDVDVIDRGAEVAILSLHGPASAAVLASLGAGDTVSAEPFARGTVGLADREVVWMRVPSSFSRSGEAGFDVWVPADALDVAWSELAARVEAAGGAAVGWTAREVLRIEAGRARWGAEQGEDSFPNEIGWDAALTYDRCYVGQEVVARMRTYGSVNRRMFRLVFEGGRPAPGAAILVGEREVGRVTSVAPASDGGDETVRGLGIVKRRAWDGKDLRVDAGASSLGVRLDPPDRTEPAGDTAGSR